MKRRIQNVYRSAAINAKKNVRVGTDDWQTMRRMPIDPRDRKEFAAIYDTDGDNLSWYTNGVWAAFLISQGDSLHLLATSPTQQPPGWAVLQQIKNDILGPEQEMVELYPAESRVVNAANGYHLWGVRGAKLDFGYAAPTPAEKEYLEKLAA